MRIMLCHRSRPFRNAPIPQGFSYILMQYPLLFPQCYDNKEYDI